MKRAKSAPMMIEGKHPLVVLRSRMTVTDIAKALGHKTHATVSLYCTRAKKKRTTTIPAEWCLSLAALLCVKPAVLRPDVYREEWHVPSSEAVDNINAM